MMGYLKPNSMATPLTIDGRICIGTTMERVSALAAMLIHEANGVATAAFSEVTLEVTLT